MYLSDEQHHVRLRAETHPHIGRNLEFTLHIQLRPRPLCVDRLINDEIRDLFTRSSSVNDKNVRCDDFVEFAIV